MAEMKTLNGYEVVDAKAREDIVALQEAVENIEIPDSPEGEGGSDWKFTEDRSHWELYQAKEIYIKCWDGATGGKLMFSHLILLEDETLGGNYSSEDIMFASDTTTGRDRYYWRYNGSEIEFYFDEAQNWWDISSLLIAYKV